MSGCPFPLLPLAQPPTFPVQAAWPRVGSAGVLLLWPSCLYFLQVILMCMVFVFFPPHLWCWNISALIEVLCPLIAHSCFWSNSYLQQNANVLDAWNIGQQCVPALSTHLLSKVTFKCDIILFVFFLIKNKVHGCYLELFFLYIVNLYYFYKALLLVVIYRGCSWLMAGYARAVVFSSK